MRLAFALFLSALQVPSKQKSTLLGAFYCERVTKRRGIEVKVSKSSVLNFYYTHIPKALRLYLHI